MVLRGTHAAINKMPLLFVKKVNCCSVKLISIFKHYYIVLCSVNYHVTLKPTIYGRLVCFIFFTICAVSIVLVTNCTHGEIRVNSASNGDELEGVAGRLEICYNNAWFVICSGYPWQSSYYSGLRNERVVCLMLGYTTSGIEIQLHHL